MTIDQSIATQFHDIIPLAFLNRNHKMTPKPSILPERF
jgi:hypothetical protein